MIEDIAIYGFGGFGREIACLIKDINSIKPRYNLVGFFDDNVVLGTTNPYGSILGGLHELNAYSQRLCIVMAIASPDILSTLIPQITNPNVTFPNLYASNTHFFDKETFTAGRGNVAFFGCRFSCNVTMGNFNLINAQVAFGHDARIGDYNVFGPSARLSGDTHVGDENFFGVASILLQGKRIGNQTRVGAGSIVMRNTKDGYLYFGNPAKK